MRLFNAVVIELAAALVPMLAIVGLFRLTIAVNAALQEALGCSADEASGLMVVLFLMAIIFLVATFFAYENQPWKG